MVNREETFCCANSGNHEAKLLKEDIGAVDVKLSADYGKDRNCFCEDFGVGSIQNDFKDHFPMQ